MAEDLADVGPSQRCAKCGGGLGERGIWHSGATGPAAQSDQGDGGVHSERSRSWATDKMQGCEWGLFC